MPDIFLCRARSFQSNLYYLYDIHKVSVSEVFGRIPGQKQPSLPKTGSFAMAFFRLLVTIDVLLVLAPSTAIR